MRWGRLGRGGCGGNAVRAVKTRWGWSRRGGGSRDREGKRSRDEVGAAVTRWVRRQRGGCVGNAVRTLPTRWER